MLIDCFIYSLTAVLPILIMILLGNILSRKMLSKSFFDQCDKLVFKVALPVFLFCKLVESDISHLPDMTFILYCMAAILGAFTLISIGAGIFLPKEKRGSFVHGTFRANFSIIGFVLAENMLSDAGVTALACATPFVIILSNILAVTSLTLNAPNDKKLSFGETALHLIRNIVTNPLIIGVALAIPFMVFGIELPQIAATSVNYIKSIATPLALLSLGAVETTGEKFRLMPESIIASVIKLIIIPVAFISIAVLLGFRGAELAVIMILGTSPTAATSYIMSKNMHSDGELAKQIVLLTTVMCSFTIFVFAFILKYLELI